MYIYRKLDKTVPTFKNNAMVLYVVIVCVCVSFTTVDIFTHDSELILNHSLESDLFCEDWLEYSIKDTQNSAFPKNMIIFIISKIITHGFNHRHSDSIVLVF